MIDVGAMDREIVIQTATRSQDATTGQDVLDWDAVADQPVWAQWLPGGTREQWQAQQRLGSYIEGVFRIYDIEDRPTPDLSRILFESRYYDVKGVVEIGRGEGLELSVVARGESV